MKRSQKKKSQAIRKRKKQGVMSSIADLAVVGARVRTLNEQHLQATAIAVRERFLMVLWRVVGNEQFFGHCPETVPPTSSGTFAGRRLQRLIADG